MEQSRRRNWITREEIAQISEARAHRLVFQATNLTDTELASKVFALRNQAAGIRAIDALDNPVGSRVP